MLCAVLRLLAVPAAAFAVWGMPDVAAAVEAVVHTRCEIKYCASDQLSVVETPGAEANNEVEIAEVGSAIRVSDGAGVVAGPGCVAESATVATCEGSTVGAVRVDLGKLDDSLAAATLSRVLTAHGGEGDDVLQGSDLVRNELAGGLGNDVLHGGPLSDSFPENLGDDRIFGNGGANDTVDYPGIDDRPVRVNLSDPGPDGAADERDQLAGIESVAGTEEDDILVGDNAANVLDGGGGTDLLVGLDGNDWLEGADGADALFGGSGDDVLNAWHAFSRVECGDGEDHVDVFGVSDIPLSNDCEWDGLPPSAGRRVTRLTAHPGFSGRALYLRLTCLPGGSDCRYRVRIDGPTRTIAFRSVRVPVGTEPLIRVPRLRSGPRRLREGKPIVVLVSETSDPVQSVRYHHLRTRLGPRVGR